MSLETEAESALLLDFNFFLKQQDALVALYSENSFSSGKFIFVILFFNLLTVHFIIYLKNI